MKYEFKAINYTMRLIMATQIHGLSNERTGVFCVFCI